MLTRTRRKFLTMMGATALAGCASPPIISRNDNDPFEGGIGGTGIVGVVVGFSSILVNGLKIETDRNTQFENAFGPSSIDQLSPGHSVTIHALRSADGFVAKRVTQDQLLVGTLKHSAGGLTVNNVAVHRESGSLGQAHVGQRVTVSGVWQAGGVVASRIDPAFDGPDLISGTANFQGNDSLSIGGASIQTVQSKSALNGVFVKAFGRSAEEQFEADNIRDGRFNAFTSLQQISAEGYLEPAKSAPGFRIAGLGHNFARDTRLSEIGQRRALYFGRYDGLFGANRGYVISQSLLMRSETLRSGLDSGFQGTILDL